MIGQAIPVQMDVFKTILKSVSPDITICVRGRHAIGKSEAVHQAAFEMGLPIVERRLSQLTEGDIVGLPFMHGEDKFETVEDEEEPGKTKQKQISYASTQFKPCDWLIEACEKPVLLFLDERNRALDGVKQAVFQLTDSKAFYGYKLHPDTRIVIAENIGDQYQVQACDPAEVSRCATVILDPTVEDWLEYVKDKCNTATIEYIRQNPSHLEHQGVFEPNKKYADRRSWFKLDQEMKRMGLFDEPDNHLFYALAGAFIGVEIAGTFSQFCRDRERQVSAKAILKDWYKAKKRLSGDATISNEAYVECVNKLSDLLGGQQYNINKNEACELSRFMHDCPPEPRMSAWAILQQNVNNLFAVHPFIEDLMVASASGISTSHLVPMTVAEMEAKQEAKRKEEAGETASTTDDKPKRGAKNKKKEK